MGRNKEVLEHKILENARKTYFLDSRYYVDVSDSDYFEDFDTDLGEWLDVCSILQKSMRLLKRDRKFRFPERSNVYQVVSNAIDTLAVELVTSKQSTLYSLVRSLLVNWFMSTVDRKSKRIRNDQIQIKEYFQDLGMEQIYLMFEREWSSAEEYEQFVNDVGELNSNFYRKYKTNVILFLIPTCADYLRYSALCKNGWGGYLFEALSEKAKKPSFFVSHDDLQAVCDTCIEKSDQEVK
jgi:hypothetical protein